DHLGGLKGFLEENKNVTVFIPSSFPDSIRDMIKNQQAEFTDVSGPQKISENIYSIGELSGPPKEQSIIINSKRGLIIITGCAHPGIISIIKRAKKLFPDQKIYLVMGGFHHPPLSVVQKLRDLGIKKIAPSHCTGDQVIEVSKKEYRDNFIEYGIGKTIEINGERY
ncbi:MAG: MBL fold metallo-hydrolase, partial [Deltaproteobacteria bacterium]|nr:MBL fold metallo-hydrolase [Deltaproteobacteria bacterium]